jgi:hypothetical protein
MQWVLADGGGSLLGDSLLDGGNGAILLQVWSEKLVRVPTVDYNRGLVR